MSTGTLQLRIRGPVTSAICGTTRKGIPVLDVHLTDAHTGQHVVARHVYPNNSPASHYAASALARSLRGQVAELDATNPRFRAHRLDCDALHISLPYQAQTTRKDLA